MHMPARAAVRTGLLGFVLAALAMLGLASSAWATPSDQILPLSSLKAELDASGTIPGYLKTVVKGSTITTIQVTITAITGGDTADSSLIMFNSSDPLIQYYGGIVAGMSGSPIYVDYHGTDKVIGALSYGDTDTLGGTGEATPIEAMIDIQHKYAPVVQTLDHPILTPSGVVTKIMITNGTDPLPGAIADGVVVAHPLATNAFVRGISPSSRIYKRFAARMAARNVTVTDLSRGLATSPDVGSADFTTDLVPGASVAAMYSRGDLGYGGIGTVTYTDGNTVLAYGHPESRSGAADLYMSNAWIDGIWPSSFWPYKVGRIGAVRGTITQDRSAGIMGVTGQFTPETVIKARATLKETGETTSSSVYVPRSLLSTISTGEDDYLASELPPVAASLAGSYLFDQAYTPGSAETTTKVVVRDTDAGKDYTVTIPNYISDAYDIPTAIVWDADGALQSFEALLPDDVHHYEILSVELDSVISTTQRDAQVVGAQLKQPLHAGDNRVTVSFLAHGQEATQTQDVTLTVPAGMPLDGTVTAKASGTGISQFPGYGITTSDGVTVVSDDSYPSPRETVAEVVDELNDSTPGNFITVKFTPTVTPAWYGGDDEAYDPSSSYSGPSSVATSVASDWVPWGSANALRPMIGAQMMDPIMDYRGFNDLGGSLRGSDLTDTIYVYGTPAGSATESLLGTVAPDPKDGSFDFPIEDLSVNTSIRLHVDATDDGWSAADAYVTAYVRPWLGLASSASSVRAGKYVKLSATVYPGANAGAKVVFEAYAKKAWRRIATKSLSSGSAARASTSWKVPRGSTRVRVRFLGSAYNYGSVSGTRTIKGR